MGVGNIRKPACHNCEYGHYWISDFYCDLTGDLVDTFFICKKYVKMGKWKDKHKNNVDK